MVRGLRVHGSRVLALTGALAVLSQSVVHAQITTDVADIGFNVKGFVTSGITALGGIVAVACAGYAAFLLVRKGLGWMRMAMK